MKGYPELAVLLFMIAYSTSTPFWIPSTFFILIGSFVFGRAFGLLYGFIIFTFVDYIWEMIGVVLAFLNGRYLFRKWVQNWIHSRPKLLAISEALTHNAKKLVFLLRASNLTPYDALNYTWSVTDMKLWDYILGNTSIIICDAPYIYVWVSITDLSNVSNSMEGLGDWYYVLLSIGIAITIGVVIAVIFYSRREFRKTLLEIERKKAIENDSQFQERRQSITVFDAVHPPMNLGESWSLKILLNKYLI